MGQVHKQEDYSHYTKVYKDHYDNIIVEKRYSSSQKCKDKITEEEKNNKRLFHHFVTIRPDFFFFASDKLKDDKEYISQIILVYPEIIDYVSKRLKQDREIVSLAFSTEKCKIDNFFTINQSFRDDKDIVMLYLLTPGNSLQHVSKRLKSDKEVLFQAYKSQPKNLNYIESFELQKEMALELIAINGDSFFKGRNILGLNIIQDEEILKTGIEEDPHILEYGTVNMKNDRELVKQCLERDGMTMRYVSHFNNDFELGMTAVKSEPISIKLLSLNLQDNDNIVREVMKKKGYLIKYASPRIRNTKDLIMEFLEEEGSIYKFLSSALKKDRQIVELSLSKCGIMIEYIPSELRLEKDISLIALKNNRAAIHFTSEDLRKDAEIEWIGKRYFKTIRQLKTYDLHFLGW
eukprot:gene12246-5831_t